MVYSQYKKLIDFLSNMKHFLKKFFTEYTKEFQQIKKLPKLQKKKTYATMPYSGNQVT